MTCFFCKGDGAGTGGVCYDCWNLRDCCTNCGRVKLKVEKCKICE